MMRKLIIILVALVATLAVPSVASANYYITQRVAESAVKQSAEDRYYDNGVDAKGSYCYPQFHKYVAGKRYAYTWHRWTCVWYGFDGDMDAVYGAFRITGHTGNNYGYLPIGGGLKWDTTE